MEELHPEGSFPIVADLDSDTLRPKDGRAGKQQDANSDEDIENFVECPIEGCLEQIVLAELDEHVGFHAMEENEETASAGANSAADVAMGASSERQYRSPYSGAGDADRPSREHHHHHHRHHRRRSRSPNGSAVDAWKKIFSRKQARNSKDLESRPIDEKTPRKRLGVRNPHFQHREGYKSGQSSSAAAANRDYNRDLS